MALHYHIFILSLANQVLVPSIIYDPISYDTVITNSIEL